MIELRMKIKNEHFQEEPFEILRIILKPGDELIISHLEESA
jgi:hypothetical protein